MRAGRVVAVCALMLLVAGCSGIPGLTSQAIQANDPKLDEHQRDYLPVPPSTTVVGRFNAKVIFLADQLERNADRNMLANSVMVTSFVNLNRLAETTPLGQLVAENLIHELQVRKWHVLEARLAKSVVINDAGEFALSRDIHKIRELYKVSAIVVGTYAVSGVNIILNARVIDAASGMVISSAQVSVPGSWFVRELLTNDEQAQSMKIIHDNSYGHQGMARGELGVMLAPAQSAPHKTGGKADK